MVSDPSIQLIEKILSNSASDAEIDQFNTWLEESVDNNKLYQQVKTIWDKLGSTHDSLMFNEAAAKEKIISKIRRHHNNAREIKARFWIAAAASLLLLTGIGYLLYNSGAFRTNNLIYSTNIDEVREVALPDSSHVWLNEKSNLRLAHAFNKRQRKVLLQGEAFFEVARNEEKIFKVIAGKTTTRVLGTSFNLKCDKNRNVQLIVNSGSVEFSDLFALKRGKICKTGDMVNFESSSRITIREENKNLNYLSWKTGILTFSDTPLGEVCEILSKHFKVSVNSNIDNTNLSLTGSFKNEDLQDILSTIAITLDITVKRTENGFLLSGV